MAKKIENFTDIEAWKHGHRLTLEVYKLTKGFPKEEMFGLVSQLRRASASIGANIAEGMGRYSYKERVRFLYNSRGSVYEVENFLILAKDLGYANEKDFTNLINMMKETVKTINGFIRSTERLSGTVHHSEF